MTMTREALLRYRNGDPGPPAPTRGSAAPVDTRPEWMHRAACRGSNTDMFYPAIGENARPAKQVCAGCPVKAECLDYVDRLDPYEADHGVWGGLSPKDRIRLRRGDSGLVTFYDECQTCGVPLVGRQRTVCSRECRRVRQNEGQRVRRNAGAA